MSSGDEHVPGTYTAELPWPPPGLEHLEGALAVPIRRGAIACLLLVLPVLWALTSSESGAIHGGGLAFLLIAVGLVLFLGAILRTAGVIDQARRAMLLGYPRALIAEVASDFDRRAGALALELEPYASVPPDARAQARRLRVLAAGAAVLAVLVTPLVLALAVLLAVRSTTPLAGVLALALAPGVLLVLAATALRLWTATLLQWSRSAGAWDPSPVSLQDRVDAWRARFAPDQKAQRPRLLPVAIASIGGIIVFVFVVAMLSLPVLLALRGGNVGEGYVANQRARSGARVAVVRPYRLPVDSSIHPLVAGAALYDVVRVGPAQRLDAPPDRLQQSWLPGIRLRARMQHTLFTTAFGTGSPALRDSLAAARAHPADSLVALVARAPAADVVGARFGTAAPERIDFMDLAVARNTLRDLGHARAARAGFLASEGRTAEAELALREAASVAVLLYDEATTAIDALFAGMLAASVAEGLAALYAHTGRMTEANALLAAVGAASRGQSASRQAGNPGRVLRRTLADSTAPAFVRWEALQAYTIQQRCRNPRTAVFETRPRGSLDELRALLIRRPSDAIVFESVTTVPLDDLDRGVPRMVRRALTALVGAPSQGNLCLWAATYF
jgi:hypothetical protein